MSDSSQHLVLRREWGQGGQGSGKWEEGKGTGQTMSSVKARTFLNKHFDGLLVNSVIFQLVSAVPQWKFGCILFGRDTCSHLPFPSLAVFPQCMFHPQFSESSCGSGAPRTGHRTGLHSSRFWNMLCSFRPKSESFPSLFRKLLFILQNQAQTTPP